MEITKEELDQIVKNEESRNAIVDATALLTELEAYQSLPVDSLKIAKAVGFEIREPEHLAEPFLATLWYEPDGAKRICLPRNASLVKKRCACAHILGHHFNFLNHYQNRQHPFRLKSGYQYCQLPYATVREEGHALERYERYANVFAGFLLMPYSEIPDDLYTKKERAWEPGATAVEKLASEFGVSKEAVTSHLKGLAKLDRRAREVIIRIEWVEYEEDVA